MLMMKKEKEDSSVDRKIIDHIRGLGIDMIHQSKSGHPGIVLGASPIISTLYANHLVFDQDDPNWVGRDRFVLSAGHGSALLYATLYMAGYHLTLDDLKQFRQFHSITPGHPEFGVTDGVDVSTGPLGQGFATSVGMAIAEEYLEHYFGEDLIHYYTYVLCGDGDLMEGISYEAASLAGHLGLKKLIVLYDSNDVTLDDALNTTFEDNIKQRFESCNWDYQFVADGENTAAISDAITKAKLSDKPSIIEIKTVIGRYSKNQGTSLVHGAPLEEDDLKNVKEKLGLRDIPFSVSNDAISLFHSCFEERNKEAKAEWNQKLESLDKTKKMELEQLNHFKDAIKLKELSYEIPTEQMEATRVSSGKIINAISKITPFFIGGSADVSKSTNARIKNTTDYGKEHREGRNINFGIREHTMGAIANGIALSGITPFVSTFFSFSDYLRPSIRMSALMDLPVIYVFTHDSISVGEDGPTHQPVEQLASLRAMPNLDVYRPADANEVVGCYKTIFEERRPAVVVLGRNKVKIEEVTNAKETEHGAYIVMPEMGNLEAIIIATGEEVHLALEVAQKLQEKAIAVRVVSMPSQEVFERQQEDYKETILPKNIPTFVIEAGSSMSWYQYTTCKDHLFTVDKFGASGKYSDVMEAYGFTVSQIEGKIEQLLK